MTVADLPELSVLHRIAEDESEPDRRRAEAVVELLGGATQEEVAAWLGWSLDRVRTAVASARERGEVDDA